MDLSNGVGEIIDDHDQDIIFFIVHADQGLNVSDEVQFRIRFIEDCLQAVEIKAAYFGAIKNL
ncbi:hypothetical protein ACUN24_03005 [Pedobacter sp. WC2501]|uniref:hypothetical protein n=1 Tax=Pedobacter sp. WC2501 TaxID=3461400 RepID=UPI004046531F